MFTYLKSENVVLDNSLARRLMSAVSTSCSLVMLSIILSCFALYVSTLTLRASISALVDSVRLRIKVSTRLHVCAFPKKFNAFCELDISYQIGHKEDSGCHSRKILSKGLFISSKKVCAKAKNIKEQ